MKKCLFILACTLGLFSARAQDVFQPVQKASGYYVLQDLTKVENDLLPVQIVTPKVEAEEIEFHMPRIIPGTYDVHNYGRFVKNIKALTADGAELPIDSVSINRWKISDAKKLYKISYQVEDSYDFAINTGIFEPAGTSHEDSVFLLNNFGYIGYLEGRENEEFELNIRKPKGFYGATALQGEMGEQLDRFTVKDYFTLHDNPLMYTVPDTAWHRVGNARVLVSVYSPNQIVFADSAMKGITAVLDAAAKYLGGELPVNKYAVLLYTAPMTGMGGGYGALEHHTSTVLYMPEMDGERFYSSVKDITSHEFFHIITPLGIHSEHVADFDFIDPEISEHIWLYEGVTEYNSHIVQVRDGIYTPEEFLDVMRDKLKSNDRFNPDIPLTQASKHTLTFFKDQYLNFYQKGALAAMALDLKLITLSDGKYRLVNLLEDLGNTYGADTFFVDDNLFDIMAETTYPEIEEFLARHIASTEPLPLKELMAEVGINYQPVVYERGVSPGGYTVRYNFETERLVIKDTENMNEFGKKLGLKEGDEIIEFNGEVVNIGNMRSLLSEFYEETEPGDKVKMLVARKNEAGEYEEEKLKARAILVDIPKEHVISIIEDASPQQLRLRKAWLNK